jgi:CubicO group peptidase (beta-lactamase class C family)
VSKQFTAAAILLLARDGKLSIDDPVKKYIPELPDYQTPLTIRHLLTHTSGLRDWGSVEAIAGWPRTSRAYTHAHVLDIVSRQKTLNFTPGTRWSYSNTGYNLAAIIVARVSGESFADFTSKRIFTPVGMSHTSWRDDFTRVVKHRAVAYASRSEQWHTDMPFENVYGNGGLLTTVGDLLTWNANFTASKIADDSFEALQQQAASLSDGRPIGYAFGLFERTADGVRIVEHSGSTAGYSAHLLRMPDQKVSVAVLCNATTARATEYAHQVADLYLPNRTDTVPAPAKPLPAGSQGLHPNDLFRNVDNGTVIVSPVAGSTWKLAGDRLTVTDRYGVEEVFERVPKASAGAALDSFAGRYRSDEAEAVLTVAVANGELTITRRPDAIFRLSPLYADAFRAPQLGTIIFRRDAAGRVSALSVVDDRVWNLRFVRE